MTKQLDATVADIEPLAAIVRVIPTGKYGDPYEWTCTIRWIDRYTVELMGITKAPKPSHWRAIRKALIALGVRRATWWTLSGRIVTHIKKAPLNETDRQTTRKVELGDQVSEHSNLPFDGQRETGRGETLG